MLTLLLFAGRCHCGINREEVSASWWRHSITLALSLWILISLFQKEHFWLHVILRMVIQ